ncbi:hypothetical protein DACRYDRAFT_110156 [Dacryopinax primogenitus]|uniref:Uncharacterized protein n=1 Tax=Dacryopinax primogenitus (strain DJM 731) TaxID=1858805 RepID=M5FV27_DACPD|nr:uncharacterized protein DACRYDRAFT_110156 [Dacryopinax primogenitus]EJT99434.1 hypothetical protein DACRYDRAFT_110156 [Dacryopinax primogenitus]
MRAATVLLSALAAASLAAPILLGRDPNALEEQAVLSGMQPAIDARSTFDTRSVDQDTTMELELAKRGKAENKRGRVQNKRGRVQNKRGSVQDSTLKQVHKHETGWWGWLRRKWIAKKRREPETKKKEEKKGRQMRTRKRQNSCTYLEKSRHRCWSRKSFATYTRVYVPDRHQITDIRVLHAMRTWTLVLLAAMAASSPAVVVLFGRDSPAWKIEPR